MVRAKNIYDKWQEIFNDITNPSVLWWSKLLKLARAGYIDRIQQLLTKELYDWGYLPLIIPLSKPNIAPNAKRQRTQN